MPLHPQVKTLARRTGAGRWPGHGRRVARRGPHHVQGLDRLRPARGGRAGSTTASSPVRWTCPSACTRRRRRSAADAPLLVWLHGGGWVIGDLDTADATARALANRSGAVVVSVDYRLAPEHAAPGRARRRAGGLTWAVENAELLGVDASRVAVGGDSAGGNLAAALCLRVRDEFGPDIDFQLLVYPVTDCTLSHPSIEENAEGYFLTKDTMVWFVGHYLGDADPKDPSVSPLHADVARRSPACARDHGGVRPAPRRRRGLRRRPPRGRRAGRVRAVRRPDPRLLPDGRAARRRPRSRSTRREPRSEPRARLARAGEGAQSIDVEHDDRPAAGADQALLADHAECAGQRLS